ncbi:MAG TPA: DegT/DnrJ/EryC1/StrS family aminotransferase [Atribacteraceae bacterium]|nr:DegT/DnrJ/EryC1/StrS family aminotransferase [Atribacteraceae bacterium]
MKYGLEHERLAIDGGRPVKTTPSIPMFPGGLEIGEEEKQAVWEVLDNKYLFRYYGPGDSPSRVKMFEEEFSQRIGTRHALAVNSGTSALIASLVAVGVGPGDEVIVPGYTFFASCAAILAAKAIPVIAEVDDSLTLDPVDFEKKITTKTKAVMPVHMRGAPCDMDRILEIAAKHNLRVIEDVAQACGGSFQGKPLGSMGECNAFSFQFHKIITAGEGGMVTTDSDPCFDRAQEYHDTAACWRPGGPASRFVRARYRGELFPGVNFRMSELIGAVMLVQLHKLDGILSKMRRNKQRIKAGIGDLAGIGFRRLNDPAGDTGIALIFFLESGSLAEKFAKALQAEGVVANSIFNKGIPDWHIYSHWEMIMNKWTATPEGCPYTCPYHQGPAPDYSPDMCPQTLALLERSVHLDIPPQMSAEDCDLTVEAIRKVAHAYL